MAFGGKDKFNVVAWIFTMKNAFGWADRQEIESRSKFEVSSEPVLDELTDEELERLVRAGKKEMTPEEWESTFVSPAPKKKHLIKPGGEPIEH